MRAESGGPLDVSLPGLVGGPFRKHEKEARRRGGHPYIVSSGLNVPTIQADDCVASNAKGLFVPPPPRWPRRGVRVADWGEVYQRTGRRSRRKMRSEGRNRGRGCAPPTAIGSARRPAPRRRSRLRTEERGRIAPRRRSWSGEDRSSTEPTNRRPKI